MLFFLIAYLLWIGGVNVGGGGNTFFKVGGRGGEGFLKVETKVPEEDFSNSIAWSLSESRP